MEEIHKKIIALNRHPMFSLLCCLHHLRPTPSTELRRQSRKARDAGSLTSRVNGSVRAKFVVSTQAILDPRSRVTKTRSKV